MKKLDTSPIAEGVAFKPKGGTLEFLQLANQEVFAEIMKFRVGANYDPTKGYILNGCINTGSGSNYVISAGSVFFNGEVFLVPAVSFTISGSNVAEGVITTTQYTDDADPSTFTDGSSKNVHNIRQIVFGPALAGSGAFDFVNAVNLAYMPQGAIGQTIEWYMPGSGSQNTLLATYFNPGTLQGIHPLTLGWMIDDGGYFTAAYLAGDTDFGTIGHTSGNKEVTLDPNNIPPLLSDDDFANGAGTIPSYAKTNTAASLGSIGINSTSPTNPFSILPNFKVKLKITRYA